MSVPLLSEVASCQSRRIARRYGVLLANGTTVALAGEDSHP
jgi:hypothetical protein